MPEFAEHSLIKPETIESRAYQENLVESVLEKGNTLVVAPTALGKTVIAVLVAACIIERDKSAKVLFLAPTKPLAMQHQQSFRKFLAIDPDQITLLTGTVKPKTRADVWDNAIVVAATPQTIRNDLKNKSISLEDVQLLIIDECHRCVKDYAYVYVAEHYMKQARKPLILALTASPGSEDERLEAIRRNLFVENIELKTHEDEDVKPYVHEIDVRWINVDLPREFIEIREHLENFILSQMDFFKKIGMIREGATAKYSRKLLIQLQARISAQLRRPKKSPIYFQAASKIAALLKVSHAHTLLETQGITALQDYWDKMQEISETDKAPKALTLILKNSDIQNAIVLTKKLHEKNIEHPKVEKLAELLQKRFAEKPESRAIVFNHYRGSAQTLTERLSRIAGIKPLRFVGQASKGRDKGMTQEEQRDAIEDFKAGKYNTIIATSVGEEGLDIPSVDLVVFYEAVPSEIRSIQRRGRTGRLKAGEVCILLAKDTKDEAFYWSAQSKEKKMHRKIKEMSKDIGSRKPRGQTKITGY